MRFQDFRAGWRIGFNSHNVRTQSARSPQKDSGFAVFAVLAVLAVLAFDVVTRP